MKRQSKARPPIPKQGHCETNACRDTGWGQNRCFCECDKCERTTNSVESFRVAAWLTFVNVVERHFRGA